MRRGSRAGLPGHPSRPRPRSTIGGLAERVRSVPSVLKLAIALSLGWSLYITLFVGKGRRATLGGGKQAGGVALEDGRGGDGRQRVDTPTAGWKGWGAEGRAWRSFRQLNMLGFEKDGGKGGEWKTCKSFKETELSPHKKPGQVGYDEHLRQVKATPGTEWDFVMTEDPDAEWLGLHQWDDSFKYGSEEADRRVARLGYCRVHMPSVPRTGSTWFRAMFEAATGQPTFSMWPERGTFKEKYTAFSSDDPCGASLDHMEGQLSSRKIFPCRDVKPPNATSPILYKSHTPFFPSYNKPSLMPEDTCMLLLLVRNPMDNQDAWMRYMAGKGQIMREYLPVWQGHLSHWVAAAGDIPIYIFRYEDMLYRAEDTLRRVLQTLPGGWNWSEESIAKAMRLYGPKKPFEEKCGSGITKSTVAEVAMVREHYGSYLRHFGYRFVQKK